MSVRTDKITLLINITGDSAKNQLNELRKSIADINTQLKRLKNGDPVKVGKNR